MRWWWWWCPPPPALRVRPSPSLPRIRASVLAHRWLRPGALLPNYPGSAGNSHPPKSTTLPSLCACLIRPLAHWPGVGGAVASFPAETRNLRNNLSLAPAYVSRRTPRPSGPGPWCGGATQLRTQWACVADIVCVTAPWTFSHLVERKRGRSAMEGRRGRLETTRDGVG